jgi:hypothetical protein
LARITVTTEPVRIIVEMPASTGEPARRIEADSPEGYAHEYGSDTTFIDPDSPLAEWVRRDLDDFYRLRREDADLPEGPGSGEPGEPAARTAMGLAPPGRRPREVSETEAGAMAEIARLRGRLYRWRQAAGGDAAAQLLVADHLAHLTELAKAARTGENVSGRLAGIREELPAERRLLRPIPRDRVESVARQARRAAERSQNPETVAELNRIGDEADALSARMAARPGEDARVAFDTLRRQLRRAGREDYEVVIDLGDPGQRAQMVGWFEQHLTPLTADPVGELLAAAIVRHLGTADALTLQQSPRSAGTPVAQTEAMRRQVLDALGVRGRYPPEYVAAFAAAAQGQTDGWPRTPDGRAWEVDHVSELWVGGADDATNYMALPPAVHDLKTSILAEFRREFRGRAEEGEQVDLRATEPRAEAAVPDQAP